MLSSHLSTRVLSHGQSDKVAADPTAQRHVLVRPAFIFAIALTLRLATGVIFIRGGNVTIDSVGFDERFTEGYESVGIARSLASGNGFSAPWPGAGPTAWVTPVLPGILAADMLLFGLHSRATLVVFVIFNELCSALTIFPVFLASKRIAGGQGGYRIGALAAWVLVLNPTAGLAACKEIWYTTLSGLLAALLLWATLAVRDMKNPIAWTGCGLLWGALLMTHPSFLVWMPVALLWLVWARRESKRLTLAALTCFTAVLCCVPWTIRNFAVFQHVLPLRSNFGLELWRYNHDGLPLHPNQAGSEHDAFLSLGEYAYTQEKKREALIWIQTHPGAFMLATAQRVMSFWLGAAHPLRRLTHQSEWFFKVKALFILVFLGMVLRGLTIIRRKRREYFWLLASFPAIFPLVYYITVTSDFHRFPIDPILAIIAAFAVNAWLPNGRLNCQTSQELAKPRGC
jgi:4-amino-4-deoxy-L-arabinose transferase-like glycosyltransferase